jgi:hypothetical protein
MKQCFLLTILIVVSGFLIGLPALVIFTLIRNPHPLQDALVIGVGAMLAMEVLTAVNFFTLAFHDEVKC